MTDLSDGIVMILKGGDDGTRMVSVTDSGRAPWEVVEGAAEPTIRVVLPQGPGDLSDGAPEPIEHETSAKTQMVEVLPAETRLQLFQLLAQRGTAQVHEVFIQVMGTRGSEMRPVGQIGVIIIRVHGWGAFLDLLEHWMRTDFFELESAVPPYMWGPAQFLFRCFATVAREWRGMPAPDGSMVIRLEEPAL